MKSDWTLWRHIKETAHQSVTLTGLGLWASTVTAIYVLVRGIEVSLWPAIFFCAAMWFNHTGRWIIPQGIQAWLQAKQNGQPSPPVIKATVSEGSATVTAAP